MTTLLRALIDSTGLSRRSAFAAIREARVAVGGMIQTEPSTPFTRGPLILDGVVQGRGSRTKTYLLLNKPAGYVTTRSDELGRPTVLDLVPRKLLTVGLHPVGRLDLDTSGLLLLTDDGDLTFRLTHPSHEVEKEYWVGIGTMLSRAQLDAISHGISIDGRLRRPISLRRLDDQAPYNVSIVVGEGRKRQVKRMFEAVGTRVRELKRVREGSLRLGTLAEGAVRPLTAAEVRALRQEGGIEPSA